MDIKIKAFLFDTLNAINEIDSFFLNHPKTFLEYKNDIKKRRAVERNIEIIGEAMSRLLQSDFPFELSNSRKIVDTRNRIIHGYDTVSDEIMWNIIEIQLLELRTEVEQIIET
jgi:uncharacterized protein with HEPN domain